MEYVGVMVKVFDSQTDELSSAAFGPAVSQLPTPLRELGRRHFATTVGGGCGSLFYCLSDYPEDAAQGSRLVGSARKNVNFPLIPLIPEVSYKFG